MSAFVITLTAVSFAVIAVQFTCFFQSQGHK